MVLSLTLYNINQRAVRKQVQHFTAKTTDYILRDLTFHLQANTQENKLAAAYFDAIQQMNEPKKRKEFTQQFFALHPDFLALGFYTAEGTPLTTFLSNEALENHEEPPLVLSSAITGEETPSRLMLQHHTQEYQIQSTLKAGDKRVVIYKKFPYMQTLQKDLEAAFGRGFVILNDSGELVSSPSWFGLEALPQYDKSLFLKLPKGRLQEFQSEQRFGRKSLEKTLDKVLIKMPDIGWGILIESPYRLQKQYIERARLQSVLLSVLCVVIIVVAGLMYTRTVHRNFRQLMKGIKALSEGRYSRKIRLIIKTLTPYEIIYLAAEFNRMAGKISGAWKSIQDLNQELLRKNEQLSELDQLKSNLIDTVSHELRTPLTNIKGYTSRLIRNHESLDKETQIKSLKIIKQQADRLSRLVEDLLTVPELERGEGLRVYLDRVSLTELLPRTVMFIQERASHPIVLGKLPDNLDVLADPDRLEQVLINLLDNANKYAIAESPISLEVSASQTSITLCISNQCEPLSQEELNQLFGKFKRLDERLTRTTHGTGLGLFITKGLVEAMGGTISLDGEHGFRVMISLPSWGAGNEPEDNV
jgi:signal transduction histidine kinase